MSPLKKKGQVSQTRGGAVGWRKLDLGGSAQDSCWALLGSPDTVAYSSALFHPEAVRCLCPRRRDGEGRLLWVALHLGIAEGAFPPESEPAVQQNPRD